jgi:hypothetical protein
MSERSPRLSRRKFLFTVGAGSAATAAAVVATKKTAPATTGTGKRETRGYHATEHVNNYYRTTKV